MPKAKKPGNRYNGTVFSVQIEPEIEAGVWLLKKQIREETFTTPTTTKIVKAGLTVLMEKRGITREQVLKEIERANKEQE